MAIELYGRGARLPAVRAHNPRLPRRKYRFAAHKKRLRDPATRQAVGLGNLYPVGEGAGYAGGIVSAAVDGIKSADRIIRTYAPPR